MVIWTINVTCITSGANGSSLAGLISSVGHYNRQLHKDEAFYIYILALYSVHNPYALGLDITRGVNLSVSLDLIKF